MLLLPIPIDNDLLLNYLNESLLLINEFTPSFQYIYPYYINFIIQNYNKNKKTRKCNKIIQSFNSIGISSFIILIHHNMYKIRYNVVEIMNKEIDKLCEIMNEIEVDLLNHIIYCIIIEMDKKISNMLFELFEKLLQYLENRKSIAVITILECLIIEFYYYINYIYGLEFDKSFIQIPNLPSSVENIEWYYIGNKINIKENIQKYSRFLSILTTIYSDKNEIYNQFIVNMLNNDSNYYIIYTVMLSFLMVKDCLQIPLSFLELLLKYENYELPLPLYDSDVIKQLKIDIQEIERFKNEKKFPIFIKDSDNYIELIENINSFCESFGNEFSKWKNSNNIKKDISIYIIYV